MKAMILSCMLFCFSITIFAQQSFFFPSEAGIVLTYNNYDAKGKLFPELPDMTYTIDHIEKRGNATIMHVTIGFKDKKGEKVDLSEEVNNLFSKMEIRIENDTTYWGNKSSMESLLILTVQSLLGEDVTMEFTGDLKMNYPKDLSVGMKIPDVEPYKMMAKKSESGMDVELSYVIRYCDKIVEAEETLTTQAGTFTCFKISYYTEIISNSHKAKSISRKKTVQWLSLGVGLVKGERYDEKGNLDKYSVLNKITR